MVFFRRFVPIIIAGFMLAACSSNGQSTSSDEDLNPDSSEQDSGYVSGDGTVTVWSPGEREEPVELAGETFDEDDVDLADLHGDVVVLNFWYAACPPCRAEAPDLREVALDTEDDGVHFFGVNSVDGPGTAQAFEKNLEIPYPSFYDEQSKGVAAMQGKVALQAVPTTVVLDDEGRVAARVIGRTDATTLGELVDDVLAESK